MTRPIAMSVTPKNRNFLKMIDRAEMLTSYTEPKLKDRLTMYPAPIHQLSAATCLGGPPRGIAF